MTLESASQIGSAVLQRVTFPAGLFGFPECRDFLLTTTGRAGFYWLRSCEHDALAFLLADPFIFFPGYSLDLGDRDAAGLAFADAADLAVLAIVTLPRGAGEPLTANLQGPVVLNIPRGVGRQVVVPDSAYGLRCEFRVEAADAA